MSSNKIDNSVEKEIYIGTKDYPIKIQIKTFKG